MRHAIRRPLVITSLYMASGKRGLGRLYPILGLARLKTARIYPIYPTGSIGRPGRKRFRGPCVLREPAGSPEYDAAWARRREKNGAGRRSARRTPPQHHVTAGNRLIRRRHTAPLRRRNARFGGVAAFNVENPRILQARGRVSVLYRPQNMFHIARF